MVAVKWTPCEDCGTPCAYYAGSFYRCRQCGYESISGAELYDRGEASYVVNEASLPLLAGSALEPRASAALEPEQLGLSLLSTNDKGG